LTAVLPPPPPLPPSLKLPLQNLFDLSLIMFADFLLSRNRLTQKGRQRV
jgi:hypothetical protein